jgi:hypothetical protein
MSKLMEEKSSKKEEGEKKERKKLARREAELMLEAERARKDVHKAEQKLAKAQSALEAAQAELQGTETKLATLRVPGQENPSASNGSAQPVEQSTPPLTEGADSKHEPLTIASGEGSIPIQSSDEHAWPPPAIREELAEAIKEEHDQPVVVEESTAQIESVDGAVGEEGEEEDGASSNSEASGAQRTHRRGSRRTR